MEFVPYLNPSTASVSNTFVALSEAQVAALLRRCERRRRLWQGVRAFDHWLRAAVPGLGLILVAFAVARALGLPLFWVLPAVAVWLAGCALWVARAPGVAVRLPAWWLVARVDRASGAHGALLQRWATGTPADPVPELAAALPLGPGLPLRALGSAGLLALAALACLALPGPAPEAGAQAFAIEPLPVQRTQRTLAQLAKHDDAATREFVTAARKTLAAMEGKPGGLERADFDALERIAERSSSLLARDAHAIGERRAALERMDALLADFEAAAGDPASASALAEGEGRLRDQLERAGLDREQLAKVAEQARARAGQRKQSGQSGAPGPQGAFDPRAVSALRAQIGELRRLSIGEAQSGEQQGGSGVDRGPGVARLEYAHNTETKPGARFDPEGFGTEKSRETVLLGTAHSRREEEAVRDPRAVSARAFEAGTDTEFWGKRLPPQQRALLERYFDENRER